MDIDIESLSEAQLIALDHLIVARLRFLEQQRAHAAMLELRVGQRVAFQPPGRSVQHGVLTRYNTRTVSVLTDAGERWNVEPSMVWPADRERGSSTRSTKITPIHKR